MSAGLKWGGRVHFQGVSCTCLANWCWLFAGGLSALSVDFFTWASWVFSQHCGWFAPRMRDSNSQGTSCNAFFWPSLGSHTPLLLLHPLVTQTSPNSDYSRMWLLGSEVHWWPSWRLATMKSHRGKNCLLPGCMIRTPSVASDQNPTQIVPRGEKW